MSSNENQIDKGSNKVKDLIEPRIKIDSYIEQNI